MKRFLLLSALFISSIGVSFAANPSIINPSYSVDGNDVTIFWTNNSNGGNVDINLFNPSSQDRLHFGTVKISDEIFRYTKQWEGNQKIQLIPDDGGEEVQMEVIGKETIAGNEVNTGAETIAATRTVIPATPKTGPSSNLICIICASLVIFGLYLFAKKRADIE